MSKHQSITTPTLQHDDFNVITELIFLNKYGNVGAFPWRSPTYRGFWSSTLAIIRKLNKTHGLTPDQLAFYIYRCSPKELSQQEFAKAAIVAKKLFLKFNLVELVSLYREKFKPIEMSGLEMASYRQSQTVSNQPKSLFDLLKELENGQAKTG
jgi:alpha-N-acetylglucosamine transferase